MNAKHQMTQHQDVENTFTYLADLSDVNHLASEYFNWLSTLIHQAKKELDNHPAQAQNLLNIAEFLADNYANDFHSDASRLDDRLNALGGKHE